MRIGFCKTMAAALLALVSAAGKGADVSFAYEGLLLDEKGNVLSELNHSIEFRLYDQAAGGTPLWSCTRAVRLTPDGLFSVELSGPATSGESLGEVFAANASKTLYIGLTVDGDSGEIEPRQKLLSVPKALWAADTVAAQDDLAVSSNLVGTAAVVTEDVSANELTVTGIMTNAVKLMAGSMSVDNMSVAGSITGNGAIPVGGIVIWSGTVASIPDGWALCDGQVSNGHTTPNLKDRFVLAAGGKYAVDRQDGAEKVTLNLKNMPSHQHDYNFTGGNIALLAWKNSNDFYDKTGHYSQYLNTGYTSSVGGDKNGNTVPHENMPPYYALCYIMRVK